MTKIGSVPTPDHRPPEQARLDTTPPRELAATSTSHSQPQSQEAVQNAIKNLKNHAIPGSMIHKTDVLYNDQEVPKKGAPIIAQMEINEK